VPVFTLAGGIAEFAARLKDFTLELLRAASLR
jgi:hypothetical protein